MQKDIGFKILLDVMYYVPYSLVMFRHWTAKNFVVDIAFYKTVILLWLPVKTSFFECLAKQQVSVGKVWRFSVPKIINIVPYMLELSEMLTGIRFLSHRVLLLMIATAALNEVVIHFCEW